MTSQVALQWPFRTFRRTQSVVRRLSPQAHVLHGRMGLGDDVHRPLGQVSLARPRKARQQQALAVQAVALTGSSARRQLGLARMGSASMLGSRYWPFNPVTSS